MARNTVLMTALTVTIAVIIAATVLMPVLTDATTTEKTFTNEGYYYMTDDDSDYTLTYSASTRILTANGENFDFSQMPDGSYTVVSTNEFLVRIQNYPAQNYGAWLITQTTRANVSEFTFTASEGNATWQTDPYTYTSDSFYSISVEKTDWTMCKYNGTNYILFDSVLTGNGTTVVNEWSDFFHIVGTLEDGVTLITSPNIEISNAQVNATEIDGFVDLYQFQSITFVATGTSETPVNVTYNQIIIPSSVTAEYEQHMTDAENTLIMVIPVLIICAIFVVATRMLFMNGRD